ncbi:MAG: glycosyltransferase [Flavobacteriales bacterium]
MKIVIIGPVYPLRGGIADFNHALANHLSEQGHEVSVFSFSLQYPKLLFPGKTQYSESPSPTMSYHREITINSVNPISWIKTVNKISKLNPDLVVTRFWIPFMGPALGTIHRRLKKKSNVQIIAITDNVIPHEKRIGDKILTRYFLNSCDAFAVLSQQVGKDLKTFLPNAHFKVIQHPVYDIFGDKISKDIARKTLGISKSVNLILFFGFIRKYKGLDILLEAFAKSNYKKNNVHLLIAGEFYGNKEEYLKLIEQLDIKSHILIHDEFISTEKMAHYFSAADMVAQTYRTATQSGITQVGYHFDCPMLVTRVGGLSEIIEHRGNGYVCEVNPDEIAHCLNHFFEGKKYEAYSKRSRELKANFSWDTFGRELLKLAV